MNIDLSLQNILNNLDSGVLITGPENTIIFLNSYLQEYLNISDYKNAKVDEILEIYEKDKKIDSNVLCGNPNIENSGVVFSGERLILMTKSGEYKIVSVKTLKNSSQELNIEGNCIVLIQDITQKIELENMKVDFSSQTVHILRTPLTIIRNNLEFLKNSNGFQNLIENEKKNVTEIEYAAEQLSNLSQNLITINEIENSLIKLDISETHILPIIERAISELETVKTKTNNHVIIVSPLYDLPKIKLDILKMVSVFRGIILNSLKHCENSDILVKLSKEQNYLKIEIEDKGEGISETGLKFIYNKFYHSKKNPLVMEEGLGIGLYYCKKIIEAHLGTIEIQSQKGNGTTVTIRLKI